MKKILVIASAIAMALGGLTAPANAAVVSRPSIPATAAVGAAVTATAGTYTGETVSNRFWVFCNTVQSVASLENSTTRLALISGGTCDFMMLSYPGSVHSSLNLTVPRTAWGNNSGQQKLIEGKFLYLLEMTSTNAFYSSGAMNVPAPALVMPALTGGTSGFIAPGSPLNFTAGSGIPSVAPLATAFTMACSFDLQPVSPTTNAFNVNIASYPNSDDCIVVSMDTQQNAISWPWNVGSAYDGYSSQVVSITTGWYIYRVERYSDNVYFNDFYWSAPLRVGVAAQTVTYDANTGSGSIAASVANGARTVADGSALSRPGFAFSGWNTAANGSGTAIAGGASYTPSGNVTLYAQWTRIPTPPAPVFTSPISVAPAGGLLNLTGSNLASVTSISVGDRPATISTSSNGQVVVKLPDLAPGKYDLTIKNADGGIRFIDGLVVPDPNAKPAPVRTSSFVAEAAVAVRGATLAPAQRAAITSFARQYRDAREVACFVSTSRAGLAEARRAAAATCAAAAAAIGKRVRTSIIIDSVSETRTTISLVVKD